MEIEHQKQQEEKLNKIFDIEYNEHFIGDDDIYIEVELYQDLFNEDYDSDDENNINDYQNSCIYRIYCKDNNIKDEYNGSSNNLKERTDCHIRRSNNITNSTNPSFHSPVYKFIREHGGIDNWIIEKLYDYPCNSEEELTDEEDRYVRNNPNATLQGKKVKLTEEEKKNYGKLRYQAMTPEEKEIYLAYQRERKRIK